MKKIAVLMGGTSSEREVSLVSGKNIAEALASLGKYEVVPVVLDSDDLSALPPGTDAVYIALHGGWGENGGVQSALDGMGIPYTGPGAKASRIAMDKIETKRILDAAGVPTAKWRVVRNGGEAGKPPFALPCVVKIPRDGSSVGVFLAKTDAEFARACEDCLKLDGREAIVEEYIPGRETTVGIIDGEALPAIEIVARGGWYGYEEKYNSEETRYPFLSDSEDESDRALEERLRSVALDAWRATGCRGVARVDFRVAPDGSPRVLELNTSPGFTGHSLVPKAGMRTGLSFAEVADRILGAATFDAP